MRTAALYARHLKHRHRGHAHRAPLRRQAYASRAAFTLQHLPTYRCGMLLNTYHAAILAYSGFNAARRGTLFAPPRTRRRRDAFARDAAHHGAAAPLLCCTSSWFCNMQHATHAAISSRLLLLFSPLRPTCLDLSALLTPVCRRRLRSCMFASVGWYLIVLARKRSGKCGTVICHSSCL